jgi:hypothetical protein
MVIEDKMSTTIPLYRLVPFDFYTNVEFDDEIFACDLDDPPDYSWRNPDGA